MKNLIKKEKAITLIALVVTIILLLILAGITISQLTGNGIFEKVKEAKEKYEDSRQKEENILDQYTNEIDLANTRNNIEKNVNYSTNEHVVGTWIDGENIYEKTFTGLTINSGADPDTCVVDVSSLKIDHFVSAIMVGKNQNWNRQTIFPNQNCCINYNYSLDAITFESGYSQAFTDCVLTIQYTKKQTNP